MLRLSKISGTHSPLRGALDPGDHMGRSIALLGDLDGDGVQDIAAAGMADDDGQPNAGAAYVLFMNTDGTVREFQKISSITGRFGGALDAGDQFGRALGSIGDLDGDGVVDLAVGANFDDDGGTARGAVWILFLTRNGMVKGYQKISSLEGNFTGELDDRDEFGRALAPLGDLDGDGVFDLAVGASYDDDGGENRGAVWVLFLNADGTVKSHAKISASSPELAGRLSDFDYFAHSLASMGDFDGDGKCDLVAGALLDDDGVDNAGAAWFLFLNGDGTLKSVSKISQLEGGFTGVLTERSQFGVAVSSVGDVNGDWIPDLAVGAVNDMDGGPRRGAAWILFMNPDATVWSHQKLSSTEGNLPNVLGNHDWFGSALSPLGDLDGDGFFDLAVGARQDDDGGTDTGALYILFLDGIEAVLTAGYLASPQAGVAPLGVSFSDETLGVGASWLWDFGDGATSSLQSPQHTYETPGTYNVSLTVVGPEGESSTAESTSIVVSEPAVAGFSASTTFGLAPLDVAFTDSSTGDITSWVWDLGDGASSSLVSPSHTYTGPGVYRPSLTVSGPGGTNVFSLGPVVVSREPAVADFGADPSTGDTPLSVQFFDLSTGEITSRVWDFGDGTSSSEREPSHVYTQAGTYTVTLTTSGPTGFSTMTQIDGVMALPGPSIADFSAEPSTGIAPLDVQFTSHSLGGVTSWSWDFGDGSTSTLQSPTPTNLEVGTYTVALTVDGPGGVSSAIDVVTALSDEVFAGFVADLESGIAPLSVAFTDQSIGNVTSWFWDFGDGNTSTRQSPSHVYAAYGVYTVTQTVSGPSSTDTLVRSEMISALPMPPQALFEVSASEGPASLDVVFTDLSTGDVTAWLWDFGDGGTSTERNPTHTYTVPGTYPVGLTSTGPGGWDLLMQVDLIRVADPSQAAMIAKPTAGFRPLLVVFSDLSSGDVTSWSWDFGDGTSSTLQHPTHVYAEAGTYVVQLTVDGRGGESSIHGIDLIQVQLPPVTADFTAGETSGEAPLSVTFEDLSGGDPTTWSWDFGDGGSSSERAPTHVYASAGTYSVSLGISGPGGSDFTTIDDFVFVTEPLPVIAGFSGTPRVGTVPLSVSFHDESIGELTSWHWDFGDGTTSTLANPTHVYLAPGIHSVSLAVSGPGGTDVQLQPEFVEAQASPVATPYGCGVNPPGSLQLVSGDGTIGATMVFALDNPLGTQTPGIAPRLMASQVASSTFPCGDLREGFGMDGGAGEVLIHLGQVYDTIIGTPWGGAGIPSLVTIVIPDDPALVGLDMYLQGLFVDGTPGVLVRSALTSALHVTVGQ